MKKIFVLGSTNTDMVIADRKLPAPGETISGGRFMMNPGGKGANQAVAVARLAAKRGACVFVAKVGDDLFGRDAAARFRAEGIDARLVVDRRNPSGTALILVDAKGQNVISVALGANGTMSPADVKPRLKDLKGAAALLMQLETPIPTVLAAAKAAKAAGVMVVLNPAPAAKLPKELYPLIDWITPNETEAEILTGVKVIDAKSAQLAVDALKRKGVKNVARGGARGGEVVPGRDCLRPEGVGDLRDPARRPELGAAPPRGEVALTENNNKKGPENVLRIRLHVRGGALRRLHVLLGQLGQHPEAGGQELAVRALLLGLRDRPPALRARCRPHARQHR